MLPLFVYGTLLSSESQGWALAGHCLTPARLQGRLWRLPGGEPALELSRKHGWVVGELTDVGEQEELAFLEQLAAVHANGFSRRLVRVQLGIRAVRAQVWIADARHLRQLRASPLKTSDWRRVSQRRSF
jgi:gamma-glutamylcyclotransferase (GGCT)/AIG2-like uncharacterized protein YtfP